MHVKHKISTARFSTVTKTYAQAHFPPPPTQLTWQRYLPMVLGQHTGAPSGDTHWGQLCVSVEEGSTHLWQLRKHFPTFVKD